MLFIWSFAIGLLHVVWYSSLPNPLYLALGVLLGLLRLNRFSKIPLLVSAFFLGALLSTLQLKSLIDRQLPVSLDRQALAGTFEVVSLIQKSDRSISFKATLRHVTCAEKLSCDELNGQTVRLSWYFAEHEVHPGDLWWGEFKLKRPRGAVNPGGFDYQAWVLSQGLVATGYIAGEAQYLAHQANWADLREQIRQTLLEVGKDTQFIRFWLALALADRSSITPSDWQILQRTGTIHLIAISGLHIGLVAVLLHWVGGILARVWAVCRVGRNDGVGFILWLPAILSCSGAALYAALAGFSIPTTRALITCLVLHALRLVGWRLPVSTVLGVVVATVALVDPLAATSPGFWLSFMAVGCLMYLAVQIPQSEGWPARLALYARLQLALSIALVAPLLALGQMASLTAPLANLVAVPVVSLLVVPALLLAVLIVVVSPWTATIILHVADWVFAWLWRWLVYLGDMSWTVWWPRHASGLTDVLLMLTAVVLVLAPAGLRVRGLGVVALAGALLLPRSQPFDVRMTVLDVGQGLSVVVQSGNEALIYDTGPRYSESFDAGSRILLPYLRREGVREVDLVISHNDSDHSGGAQSVASELILRRSVSGESVASLATRPCHRGQHWQVGQVNVHTLWPSGMRDHSGNNASCTLLLSFTDGRGRTVRLLLPGDIDEGVERRILAEVPENLDVVIASHHGSGTSSGYEFVRHTAPAFVVYSAGHKNAYHHPSAKVSRRYRREGSEELSTAEGGALLFTWREGQLEVGKTREERQKPWFW